MKKIMSKTKGSGRRLAVILTALMLSLALCPTALAALDTDETTPRLTQQPDQLILQLGTRWAGVEFELRTDAGIFPAPVVVDESGVLTMDLGGSTTYTLSCLNSEVPIPGPAVEQAPADTAQPVSEQSATPQQPSTAPAHNQSFPMLPVVLFLGGLALAAGGGTALYMAKRSRQADYDDWEDEEDEL